MLCCVGLRRVVSVRLYCFVFCFVRLCYVVLFCFVRICYVVLVYVVLCYVLCVRGNKITNLSDSFNQVYKQPKQTHSYIYWYWFNTFLSFNNHTDVFYHRLFSAQLKLGNYFSCLVYSWDYWPDPIVYSLGLIKVDTRMSFY